MDHEAKNLTKFLVELTVLTSFIQGVVSFVSASFIYFVILLPNDMHSTWESLSMTISLLSLYIFFSTWIIAGAIGARAATTRTSIESPLSEINHENSIFEVEFTPLSSLIDEKNDEEQPIPEEETKLSYLDARRCLGRFLPLSVSNKIISYFQFQDYVELFINFRHDRKGVFYSLIHVSLRMFMVMLKVSPFGLLFAAIFTVSVFFPVDLLLDKTIEQNQIHKSWLVLLLSFCGVLEATLLTPLAGLIALSFRDPPVEFI